MYFHTSALLRRYFLCMIFSNHHCLCSLVALAGKMERMLSETSGVQIFNPLKCFTPRNKTTYILELRTHGNKTTGFGHDGTKDSDSGEGKPRRGHRADLGSLDT